MIDEANASAFTQVCALIHQVSGIAVERITLTDSLVVTLGLDSIELIDLFIQLETLDVFIETDQITPTLTVGELVALVRANAPERESQ